MSTPPFTPPGAGAPPPFSPFNAKAQARFYQEQQKAQRHAQQQAMKAQQQIWKASLINAHGPHVPSLVGPLLLIGVGVVALLVAMGRIPSGQMWSWYGHWWPLVPIGAGLILLAEWAIDLRRPTPVRRGTGFVGILILLAAVGIGTAQWRKFDSWTSDRHISVDGLGDLEELAKMPEHVRNRTLCAQIPVNSLIEIDNPRGDVKVTAGYFTTINVVAYQVVNSNSEEEAKNVLDHSAPTLTVTGYSVLLKSEKRDNFRTYYTIEVPMQAHVVVNAGHGDVSIANVYGGASVRADGDIRLGSITGPTSAHSNGSGSIAASQINGDLTLDGNFNDVTLSDIHGSVTDNGGWPNNLRINKVDSALRMHIGSTEVEVAQLPGELSVDSGVLRIFDARGQARVVTHSLDVDLSRMAGDSIVDDDNGRISIEPTGNYSVEARNKNGNVEVLLPPNVSADVDARAHNGKIISDFAVPNHSGDNDQDKSLSFKIGAGGAKLELSSRDGDIFLRKGSVPIAPTPSVPAHSAALAKPAVLGTAAVPHFKPGRTSPVQPVTPMQPVTQ